MRIFNTVQELWSYFLFCPLCQEYSRTIILQVGPDDQFTLSKNTPYEKIGPELKIYSSFQSGTGDTSDIDYVKGQCSATYVINCDNNSFELQVSDTNLPLAEKVKKSYFYFYVYGTCDKCNNSYLNSTDIEFDLEKKLVYNIQMDREGYRLISEKDKYHVTVSHDRNVVMVSRLEIPEDGVIIDSEKVLELPFFNLNLSDVPKAINKIKTLILFS